MVETVFTTSAIFAFTVQNKVGLCRQIDVDVSKTPVQNQHILTFNVDKGLDCQKPQ